MQSRNSTTMPPSVAQELATDADFEFFAECAELAGMSFDEWMAYEPF